MTNMGIPAGLKSLALRWLLPQTCAHCREDLAPDWPEPLCASCGKGLKPCEPPYCLRCCEPLPAGRALCHACAGRPWACRLIRSAFLYRGPVPDLVHGFKYRGRRDAARAAGRAMAGHFARFPELASCDALVPVPLHPARLRERGYNQAHLLARQLGVAVGLPVLDLLERCKATKPQWDLDKQDRRRNLFQAFLAKPAARDLSLVLVDDVCTSGASLEECGRALCQAGAARVAAFTFARQTLLTPGP